MKRKAPRRRQRCNVRDTTPLRRRFADLNSHHQLPASSFSPPYPSFPSLLRPLSFPCCFHPPSRRHILSPSPCCLYLGCASPSVLPTIWPSFLLFPPPQYLTPSCPSSHCCPGHGHSHGATSCKCSEPSAQSSAASPTSGQVAASASQEQVIDTIYKACAYGDIDKLRQFVEADPSLVNQPDQQVIPPPILAALGPSPLRRLP